VQVQQKSFAVLHDAVGVADVRLSFAKRFDFGPLKDEPGLECFEDVVVVTRPLVPGN
jgi:hypothetical protein